MSAIFRWGGVSRRSRRGWGSFGPASAKPGSGLPCTIPGGYAPVRVPCARPMPLRPPSPGVLIDTKYRLAERIGGGGMGDVFRAEIVAGGRTVAIKFLHAELAQNMEVAQRFFQEAQAVNKIRHPNVVEVIDAGTGEMGPYIVMEYLEGESVGAALNRVGRFEVDAVVATAVPVLEALDAAHRVGVIHRDLKPENIFIAFDAGRSAVVVR